MQVDRLGLTISVQFCDESRQWRASISQTCWCPWSNPFLGAEHSWRKAAWGLGGLLPSGLQFRVCGFRFGAFRVLLQAFSGDELQTEFSDTLVGRPFVQRPPPLSRQARTGSRSSSSGSSSTTTTTTATTIFNWTLCQRAQHLAGDCRDVHHFDVKLAL